MLGLYVALIGEERVQMARMSFTKDLAKIGAEVGPPLVFLDEKKQSVMVKHDSQHKS